jgi:hypothetical protein
MIFWDSPQGHRASIRQPKSIWIRFWTRFKEIFSHKGERKEKNRIFGFYLLFLSCNGGLFMFPSVDLKNTNLGTLYVAGFLFRENKTQVALIEKQRPAWQKGKLNGIGGRVEIDETPREAMKREFKEEAGADISQWRAFCYLQGINPEDPWTVIMFKIGRAHV